MEIRLGLVVKRISDAIGKVDPPLLFASCAIMAARAVMMSHTDPAVRMKNYNQFIGAMRASINMESAQRNEPSPFLFDGSEGDAGQVKS